MRIPKNILVAIGALAPVAPASAVLDGQIVRVGFPIVRVIGGEQAVRPGEWAPVVVRLRLDGEESFDGWIRISQPDIDGDLAYDAQRVQLLRDQEREYTLYALAGVNSAAADAFSVEVSSNDGRRVDMVSGGQAVPVLRRNAACELLTPDDYLVLSLGEVVGSAQAFESSSRAAEFRKDIRLAHISPVSLPTLWIGLQSVDAIIWDDADPTALTALQLDALLEWTRQGGVLVIAAGRTADVLAGTPKLAAMLPVEIGPTRPMTALPTFRRHMLGLVDDPSYDKPIVVTTCRTRPNAQTIIAETLDGAGGPLKSTIVADRRVERGRVVFVAATLLDLLGGKGDPIHLFRRVLMLRDMVEGSAGMALERISLPRELTGWTGFRQIGQTYLAVAMIFLGLYAFAASLGSWQFLRTRGLLRHSWSAFGVVAVVASVASVAGVQMVRGVGKKLLQISVVDADANRSTARATVYFGLKTSVFGTVDVWLPDDYPQVTEPGPTACTLMPLSLEPADMGTSQFADPGRYQVIPSRAELREVPIRGTLKQLEGRWSGSMPGRLRAQLSIQQGGLKYDWRIAADSTIVNELGADIDDAYLLYAAGDLFPMAHNSMTDPNRADKVYIFSLGAVANGQTVQPGRTLYTDGRGEELEFDQWKDSDLERSLGEWINRLTSMGLGKLTGSSHPGAAMDRHELAAMLLSLSGDYNPPVNESGLRNFATPLLSQGSARHLDMSNLVDTRTALFIGFTKDAGPASLCVRDDGDEVYRRVAPSSAITIYRVLIPIGAADSGGVEAGNGT
ncbi:MAG: hypothetical protein HOP29_20325 [Phycisphaerales bacterium]|nr:hypothetical protein [Phycisphaerales bacterium]